MQVMNMLSEQQARKVGEQIVEMLGLTKNKEGRYNNFILNKLFFCRK